MDGDLADVVQRGADLDAVDVCRRKTEFLGQEQGISRNAVGVATRVLVARFDGTGQCRDGLQEQFPLLLHELGTLNADRHIGCDGVGQLEVVLGERFLERAAVEVKHPKALARRAQDGTDNRRHGPVRDAAGPF